MGGSGRSGQAGPTGVAVDACPGLKRPVTAADSPCVWRVTQLSLLQLPGVRTAVASGMQTGAPGGADVTAALASGLGHVSVVLVQSPTLAAPAGVRAGPGDGSASGDVRPQAR